MNQPAMDYNLDTVDEPLRFVRHRLRQDAEMDITPMIDITFLLLIFFLVATRMSSQGIVDLPVAQHGTAVSTKHSVVLTVANQGGQDATIYKGDGASAVTMLTAPDLHDQQQEMEEYIDHAIRVDGKQHVLIKAAADVKHRDVARVARAARAAGDATVALLYVAVLEER